MNDAGRIGFVIRGDYDSSETYDFLDVVFYKNASYAAKKSTIGNMPEDDSEYWKVLVKAPDSSGGGYTDDDFDSSKFASKSIYGDTTVSMGRANGSEVGTGSFAFGQNVEASGDYSFAVGYDNDGPVVASGEGSHAEGGSTTASGRDSHAEGRYAKASGEVSHAEGYTSEASGYTSHAEGNATTASGDYSHAEGYETGASGDYSHAEGNLTKASGNYSHAEGYRTTASGDYSHAEGFTTMAVGMYSHAEGRGAAGTNPYAHAEGYQTTATNNASHAEGYNTIASGLYSHAEGCGSRAAEYASHAEGYETDAYNYAHAEGYQTIARNTASHTSGKYSKSMSYGANLDTQVGDVFVIGNGTGASALSNALRVTYLGDVMGTKAFQSSGADYAEFIKPWADGNQDNEDRVGYFVTIKDGLLRKANQGDYIAGITSGNPSIVGNADEDYYWRYERDEFNRIAMEDAPEIIHLTEQKPLMQESRKFDEDGKPLYDEEGKPIFESIPILDKDGNQAYEEVLVYDENNEPVMVETGNIIKNARMKLSEDYDPSLQDSYVERKDRKEWDYVGMVGVLPVRDDGTCVPECYCKCGYDGIATFAETRDFDTYMVVERIAENVVSVILN